MVYECRVCSVCGSIDITEKRRDIVGENVLVQYFCSSCDSTFSSNPPTPIAVVKSMEDAKKILAGELSAKEIFSKYSNSILELNCAFTGSKGAGTGYVISEDGYVLTNAHVVVEIDQSTDKIVNLSEKILGNVKGSRFASELDFITADVERDIALLKLSKTCKEYIKISEVNVETGEKVYAIGNSKGEGVCIIDGIVSDSMRKINGKSHMMISAMVTSGNSGGPVFNSRGELIGMVVAGRKEAAAMNYAIPVVDIVECVRAIEKEEDIRILK